MADRGAAARKSTAGLGSNPRRKAEGERAGLPGAAPSDTVRPTGATPRGDGKPGRRSGGAGSSRGSSDSAQDTAAESADAAAPARSIARAPTEGSSRKAPAASSSAAAANFQASRGRMGEGAVSASASWTFS